MLNLTNLFLSRLNLLPIGFDELIAVRYSLFRVTDVTRILLQPLLDYLDSLEVVVLALLVIHLELFKVGSFRLCFVKM